MKEHGNQIVSEARFAVDNINAAFYFDRSFMGESAMAQSSTYAHEHAWYEIHVVKRGSLTIKIGEISYVINANEALLILPHMYHITYERSPELRSVSIGFELACNNKRTTEDLYGMMQAVFVADHNKHFKKCGKLADSLEELRALIKGGQSVQSCRIHTMLTMLLFFLYDKLKSKDEQSHPEKVENAWENRNYLLDCLTAEGREILSLEELSQRFYLTKKQINRIVKKRYNMTYKQKQIRFRIENAKKQLAETNMAVDQIALFVGYSNVTSFYKTFRNYVGVTPGEYRKKHKMAGVTGVHQGSI